MAAVIAISLYSEIPRVALQSQRHKEQLLMERGLQYMRGIQVYQQVNKGQWPAKLDDVETFQNRHFARHHYIDPMTGKDDWRLIHASGGVLTDSLVTTNSNSQQQTASSQSSYISDYSAAAQGMAGDQTERPQDRRRPSEGAGAAGASDPLTTMPVASDQSGTAPADSGDANAANPANPAGNASAGGGQSGQPGAPGMPGSPPPGQNPTNPNGGYNPGYAAGYAAGIAGGTTGSAAAPPTVGNVSAPPAPGLPGAAGNPALAMINQLLTGPSPQTAPGQAGGALSGTPLTLGAGVAGVASKSAEEGIMVYNKQTLYKKWEFVFDPAKVAPVGAGMTTSGTPGAPASQLGSSASPSAGIGSAPAASGLSSAFGGSSSGTAGSLFGGSSSGGAGSLFGGSATGAAGASGGTATGPGACAPAGGAASGGSLGYTPGSSAAGYTPGSPGAGGASGCPAGGAAGAAALPPGYRPGRP